MKPRLILDDKKFSLTIDRLCYELIENHGDFASSVLIGVQPRGIFLAERIQKRLSEIITDTTIPYGKLDITFYRDDFGRRNKPLAPNDTDISFLIEGKRVIMVDDVLFTGRTIRAAMDALLDFGRPKKVGLLVLIDRRLSRHLPVQPDYVGKTVDAISSERVTVEWKQVDGADKVWIFKDKKSKT